MSDFDLVIFDCDGVLIESESIAARVESALFQERGADISTEYVFTHFTGTSEEFMFAHVLENFGVKIEPEEFSDAFGRGFWALAEEELTTTPGVLAFIDDLTHDHCVCSNSSHNHVTRGLEIAGIRSIPDHHCFSARDLGRSKPEPDVFLHAAAQFGARPERCLVIEDSLSGIRGAHAAGMTVAGYHGGNHCQTNHPDKLMTLAPFLITDDWRDIQDLLKSR